MAENEKDLSGWEVIDFSFLLYWPGAILNIILMTIIIARPILRRRGNSPILITICIINIIIVIQIYVSHFHRYSVPVYLKMRGLCELITVITALVRVFTPYAYILMAVERLYTLETSRILTLPAIRIVHSFILLGTVLFATLIITLTGILGISGGFYYDYTIDGTFMCFVFFNQGGYYFYTTMLFLIPGCAMLVLQVLLIRTFLRYKYGTMQNAAVRMRDAETPQRDDNPCDNGYSNEAGSPNMNHQDTNQETPEDVDQMTQVDAVTEDPPEDDNDNTFRQMALVAWVSLLVFFVPWILQLIIHYISWYSSHYVGRHAEHILNIFMVLYPLTWLLLDRQIKTSYRAVCCVCLPRRTGQDDEERLV